MNISVIGGTGGMGKMLIRFFRKNGIKANPVGRKTKNAEDVIQRSDVIVISVPSLHLEYAIDLIQRAGISKKQLVVSLGSIMSLDKKKLSPLKMPVLHLHQLFGPKVFPFSGKRVVVSGKTKHPYSVLLISLLKKSKVNVLSLTENGHDKLMASIQALSQFSAISLAKTLSEEGNSRKQLEATSTVTFQMTMSNIERIMAQKADLWAFLQFENLFALKIIEKHLKNVQEMIKTAKNKDYKKFEQTFNKIAKFWQN